MNKQLELRVITADTVQRVVKFMIETETEELVGKWLFETDVPDISWGELRTKADLSATQLKELQGKHATAQIAALEIERETGEYLISQNAFSMIDLYKEVMKLMGDDKKWHKTKELVAYLYQTDAKTIGELAVKDIVTLIKGATSDAGFTKALS